MSIKSFLKQRIIVRIWVKTGKGSNKQLGKDGISSGKKIRFGVG